MPQATDEQREKWGGLDGVGEDFATEYLQGRGWTLLRSWHWRKPTPDHEPAEDEIGAIQFLIDEWDFGGIEPGAPRAAPLAAGGSDR